MRLVTCLPMRRIMTQMTDGKTGGECKVCGSVLSGKYSFCTECQCPTNADQATLEEWKRGRRNNPKRTSSPKPIPWGQLLATRMEALGPCPNCKLLMHVIDSICPRCQHRLTLQEKQSLYDTHDKTSNKSRIIGFILFTAVVIAAVALDSVGIFQKNQ